MSMELIGVLIVAVTIIIVVMLWQGMSVAKTQISADHLKHYESLAEQATTAERKSADAQEKTAAALEEIRARLTAIEKLLSEVQ